MALGHFLRGQQGSRVDLRPGIKGVTFIQRFIDGSSEDMNVDGSSTPVVFDIVVPGGEEWVCFGLSLIIQDNGNNTPDGFGAITGALLNGVLIEVTLDASDNEMNTLKTNIDIGLSFITGGHIVGQNQGFLNESNLFAGTMKIRDTLLIGDDGDKLKITVRDNLLPLGTYKMQGAFIKVI